MLTFRNGGMKNPFNPVHLTLPKSQHWSSFDNIYIYEPETLSSGLFPGTPWIASSSAARDCFQAHLELHPPRPRVTLLPYFLVILLNFLLYLLLYASVYIPQLHFINMEPTASQVRNHYSQKNQEAHLEQALALALQKTANLHCQSNVWTSNLRV
jgi:hypothetical protein